MYIDIIHMNDIWIRKIRRYDWIAYAHRYSSRIGITDKIMK